jgi:hypothetical protein
VAVGHSGILICEKTFLNPSGISMMAFASPELLTSSAETGLDLVQAAVFCWPSGIPNLTGGHLPYTGDFPWMAHSAWGKEKYSDPRLRAGRYQGETSTKPNWSHRVTGSEEYLLTSITPSNKQYFVMPHKLKADIDNRDNKGKPNKVNKPCPGSGGIFFNTVQTYSKQSEM